MAENLARALEITGQLLVTQTTNEARLAVARQAGVRRVQWSALLEADTCPLCASLDGKVFDAATAPFNPPAHINCRCVWVEVGDDEVGSVDAYDPAEPGLDVLIEQHGHFLTDQETYQPLRIPSSPASRDFVFKRHRNPETGELESVLEWQRPRYEIEGLQPGTKHLRPVNRTTARMAVPPDEGGFLPPLPKSVARVEVPVTAPKWETIDATPLQSSVAGGGSGRAPRETGRVRALLPSVRDAADHAELQSIARKVIGGDQVELAGVDLELARGAVNQLVSLADDWPEAVKQVQQLAAIFPDDALFLARTTESGATVELHLTYWQQSGALSQAVSNKRLFELWPAGCARPEAVITEEVGHLVKVWLDADPSLGAELDRWLDTHPLPVEFCHLNDFEGSSEARRRYETFVRGILAGEHQLPADLHSWARDFQAVLERLVSRRRGNVGG